MINKYCYIIVISFGVGQVGLSQTSHQLLRKGDNNYKAEDYEQAEEYYRKAQQKESNLKSNFNLGNTTFKLGRYDEAIDYFLNATRKTKNKEEESKAFYNLGNAHFNNEQLEEAIESYKQSIRLDSNNDKAKYNLAICKEILKQIQNQDQQQQDQDSNDKGEENKENEDEQQEGESGEENSEDQSSENESKQDSTDQLQSNFDSTRLEKQSLDSIDAAKLLQIIQSEEQKVQEKLRKFNSNRKKPDKDW